MVVSFQHKGLKAFYATGSTRGINAAHAAKLRVILYLLDKAKSPDGMRIDSLRLHALKGDLKGFWSVWVNGNWRVIFRFVGSDVELVDYLDYH